MTFSPITIPFFISAALSAGLGVHAYQRRLTVGSRAFAYFMFAVSLYSAGYAMELASPDLQTALFWSKVQYVGILTFPTLFLVFVIQYTGGRRWLTPLNLALLFALPALLFVVKLFDGSWRLFYASAEMKTTGSFLLLSFTRGPLYIPLGIYHMVVVTLANIMLIAKRRFASQIFRKQTAVLIAAALVIYAIYILYLLQIPLLPILDGIDVNPLSYAIWAAGVSFAIYRYRLLDLVPIARDALIETLNDGVVVLDAQGRIVDANPEAVRIFAWVEPPIGLLAGEVPGLGSWLGSASLHAAGVCSRQEITVPGGSNTYEMTISHLKENDESEIGNLIVIHDISERKEVEKKLEELSLLDDLTGLHNRRGFIMLADQLIHMANRMQRNAVLFYIDVDRLKWINDNQGHVSGDQALKDVADTLKNSFRASDVVARLSGDEFVILAIESRENSAAMMLQRLEAGTVHHAKLGRNFELSFSTGLAHYEWERPQSLEALQKAADQAMYRVKQTKKPSSGSR